jgi:3-hydroxymyristoyl/3-hydroxydecanoyl-(acyl carrier protein) dehydratase
MSVRFTGMTRESVEAMWLAVEKPVARRVYDYDNILNFSSGGKPSQSYGERYTVFDEGRFIARLPRPPYQFLDQVTVIEGEPWVMKAGGVIEAEYTVPPDEWYFQSNRQTVMPFAILLEVALQPCGWLASYMGSALTSNEELRFRNLGGSAVQRAEVTPETGKLITRVRTTNVSTSGGMIIQHYEFSMRDGAGARVYDGTTYFGFFTNDALAHQIGIRDAQPYTPSDQELERGVAFDFPGKAPFPDDMLRMMDRVDAYIPDGGPKGLGFVRGIKEVDPDEWFFEAHFYQDPVWPGSLGLEAFVQLMKVAAARRWGAGPNARFETLALGSKHEWVYRGQVIRPDRDVTVTCAITDVDDANRLIRAEGFLIVDERIIYQMKDFSIRIR